MFVLDRRIQKSIGGGEKDETFPRLTLFLRFAAKRYRRAACKGVLGAPSGTMSRTKEAAAREKKEGRQKQKENKSRGHGGGRPMVCTAKLEREKSRPSAFSSASLRLSSVEDLCEQQPSQRQGVGRGSRRGRGRKMRAETTDDCLLSSRWTTTTTTKRTTPSGSTAFDVSSSSLTFLHSTPTSLSRFQKPIFLTAPSTSK